MVTGDRPIVRQTDPPRQHVHPPVHRMGLLRLHALPMDHQPQHVSQIVHQHQIANPHQTFLTGQMQVVPGVVVPVVMVEGETEEEEVVMAEEEEAEVEVLAEAEAEAAVVAEGGN